MQEVPVSKLQMTVIYATPSSYLLDSKPVSEEHKSL